MKEMKTSQVLAGVLFVAAAAPCGAVAQSTFLGFADPDLILTGKVPYHVKAMDLDGLNGIDLVVANKGNPADPAGSPPSIETFLSDGMGGFTLDQVFDSFFVTEPRQLATGFVDGDTLLDLVVADGNGNRIVVFLGRPAAAGGGFFPNPQSFLVPDLPVMSVDLGQINSGVDSFLDAVTGNINVVGAGAFDQLGRFFGDATGNFGPVSLISQGTTDPTVFVSLEMPNMVVSAENRLLNNEGTIGGITLTTIDSMGVFGPPADFRACNRAAPMRPTVVRIEDVDNSGVPDLVIPANGNQFATFPWGNGIFFAFEGAFMPNPPFGGPTFTSTKFIDTSPRPFDLAIADVNSDQTVDRFDNVVLGNKDIVITHWNATTPGINDPAGTVDLTVLIDDGMNANTYIDPPFQFTYSDFTPQANPDLNVSPRFVELVDIDGDGDLDIITTRTRNDEGSVNQPNGHIAIFKNQGNLLPPGAFELDVLTTPLLTKFDTTTPPCFTLENIPLAWSPASSFAGFPVTYTLEIASDAAFAQADVVFESTGIGIPSFTLTSADLQASLDTNTTTNYWRVTATNDAGNTLSDVLSFNIQNRADLNGDGPVNAADLPTLLGAWGQVQVTPTDTTCIDIFPLPSPGVPGGNGMIDAGDLAFLLGN